MNSKWKQKVGYQEISTDRCTVTLEPRPGYCDRGNFLAKVYPEENYIREIDGQDGWPRYYFDEERAKAEVEAWFKKRGLL